MFKWREIAAFTEFEFLLEIAGEIMVTRELDRRTERRVSLHKNFAGCFSASCASGDLCEKLKRSFAGAKIGHMQREIGVDDSDQRHIWKMQTLRDHLCANEYVNFASAEIFAGQSSVIFGYQSNQQFVANGDVRLTDGGISAATLLVPVPEPTATLFGVAILGIVCVTAMKRLPALRTPRMVS